MLEMLLKELPSSVRNALNIRVNAEKDTIVATRIVQRWRKPSNPISNTVGSISDKIDFLITAPYADKLPLKVAELIRKNVPFAVLLPLSLLNDIERTGKTDIDESVRQKRLDMKLVIATSLGQGWLINHPECKVSNSAHSVFFTTCSSNEQLHSKGTEAFHKWTESTNGANISPKSLKGETDIDVLCLKSVQRLMKDGASRKKLSPRDIRAQNRAQGKDPSKVTIEPPMSNLEDPFKMVVAPPIQESLDSTCKRTEVHPMHVISTAISPDPLESWPDKQDVKDIKDLIRLTPDQMKKGYPSSLIIVRDDQSRDRILVPKCQRLRLVVKEHETMLHESGRRVHHELVRKYYWPNMANEIKIICKACKSCQASKVRRQHLSAAFELAAKEDLPLPRQAYGIDFYGHTHGEILVALDLCTREVSLWFLPDRKMEGVAKALLSGLIFQKGVPLIFVNDEAKEFVDGAVDSMNRYLGIKQITTGGHNPRSNANVERFMQHLTSCLTKCDDTQYRNLKIYIQAIAFAHNTAFNSAINCTPFEAGHGLRARTITEARASPRLQITAEEGTELQEPDNNKWESTIFYKVCKLAERLAEDAQRQSQWHKRMNAHNLNQAGKVISDKPLEQGSNQSRLCSRSTSQLLT
jgi:transposase InsO family protein